MQSNRENKEIVMIHYKINQLDFAAVLDLYASVGWSNYTNRPQQLEQAFHQPSLFVMAWPMTKTSWLGLIRVVGDGLPLSLAQICWCIHLLASGLVGAFFSRRWKVLRMFTKSSWQRSSRCTQLLSRASASRRQEDSTVLA